MLSLTHDIGWVSWSIVRSSHIGGGDIMYNHCMQHVTQNNKSTWKGCCILHCYTN